MIRGKRIRRRGAASLGVSLAAHSALLAAAWTARPFLAEPRLGEAIEVSVVPTAPAPSRPAARSARAPAPRRGGALPGRARREPPASALPSAAAVPGAGLALAPDPSGRPGVAFAGEALAAGAGSALVGAYTGDAGAIADLDSSWLHAHRRSIERRIQREMDGTPYPHQARRMWWTGEVRVSFTLQPDGHVRDVRVVRSSGRDVLDRCAVETVIDAAPYPRPPIDQEVEVPFEFRLVPL